MIYNYIMWILPEHNVYITNLHRYYKIIKKLIYWNYHFILSEGFSVFFLSSQMVQNLLLLHVIFIILGNKRICKPFSLVYLLFFLLQSFISILSN